MRVLLKYALSIITGFLFISCQTELSPEKYAEWIHNPSHGLMAGTSLNEYSIELVYEPVQYKALKEYSLSGRQSNFEELEADYNGFYHFVLKIEPVINFSAEEKKDLATYFDRNFKNDISVVACRDTLQQPLTHLERPWDIRPYYYLLMVFKNPGNNNPCDLVFNYNGGKLGRAFRLKIRGEDIAKIPRLNITKIENGGQK